jgi:PAB-dependent poly(A)-specific ribonuclease subunit 2
MGLYNANNLIVAHAEPEAPGQGQWHLFNDFLVRSVSTEEALTFNTSWKVPSVVCFQVREANNKIDSTWKEQLDTTILYHDLKCVINLEQTRL